MPRCPWLGGINSCSRLCPKSAQSYGLWGGSTIIADPAQPDRSEIMDVSEESTPARRQAEWLENRIRATQRASSNAPSLLLYRCVQSNRGPRKLGASARKISPVRKKREKLTNFFLARLMSIFGDLKSLRVLDAGRLCAIPLL